MEGVQILNQYSEVVNIAPTNKSYILAAIVAITIGIIVTAIAHSEGFIRFICSTIVVAMFAFPVSAIIFTRICGDKVLETRADVIVSDDVSLKDFTKEYNIVEQRGDIYVVTKKTQQ